MRNRLLVAVWLVAFVAQAAGVGEALHLAVEHGQDCGRARHESQAGPTCGCLGCQDAGQADSLFFRPASRPGHDFLHCPICQALGVLNATVLPPADAPVSADSPTPAPDACQSPALAKAALAGLGPRAPPADRSTPPSA